MKLSILIPTIPERERLFNQLKSFLESQALNYKNIVEIISLRNSKEIPIGETRNKLYGMANGEYSWMIDDDDWVHGNAIKIILDSLNNNPDCIGFKELCVFIGNRIKTSNISIKYKKWDNNFDDFDYVRTPFFINPIKTELCLKTKVKEAWFGEDEIFAKDIYPLLKKENYISEIIYIYRPHLQHEQDHKRREFLKEKL